MEFRPSQISTSYKLAVEGQIDLEKITEVSSASSPTSKHGAPLAYTKEQSFPSVPVRYLYFILACLYIVTLVINFKVRFIVVCDDYYSLLPHIKGMEDYTYLAVLGRGHFGKVFNTRTTYTSGTGILVVLFEH